MNIEEFVHFYNEMMQNHQWGKYGPKFSAKYIDTIIDTRDGAIWHITLRDICTDDNIWEKIPENWKQKDGNMVKIVIRDIMEDKYKTLKERTDYILSLK